MLELDLFFFFFFSPRCSRLCFSGHTVQKKKVPFPCDAQRFLTLSLLYYIFVHLCRDTLASYHFLHLNGSLGSVASLPSGLDPGCRSYSGVDRTFAKVHGFLSLGCLCLCKPVPRASVAWTFRSSGFFASTLALVCLGRRLLSFHCCFGILGTEVRVWLPLGFRGYCSHRRTHAYVNRYSSLRYNSKKKHISQGSLIAQNRTICIKNIPSQISQYLLVGLFEQSGLRDDDFLSLTCDALISFCLFLRFER